MVGADSPFDRINAVNPTDDDFLREAPVTVDLTAKPEPLPYAVPEADKFNATAGRIAGGIAQSGVGLLRGFGEHILPDGSVNGALPVLENVSPQAQKAKGMATGCLLYTS